MNIVFIGHVDAGKSTIGGQILYLTVRQLLSQHKLGLCAHAQPHILRCINLSLLRTVRDEQHHTSCS